MKKSLIIMLLVTQTLVACESIAPGSRPEADLILRGASVYTLDAQKPWAEAIAIANDNNCRWQ